MDTHSPGCYIQDGGSPPPPIYGILGIWSTIGGTHPTWMLSCSENVFSTFLKRMVKLWGFYLIFYLRSAKWPIVVSIKFHVSLMFHDSLHCRPAAINAKYCVARQELFLHGDFLLQNCRHLAKREPFLLEIYNRCSCKPSPRHQNVWSVRFCFNFWWQYKPNSTFCLSLMYCIKCVGLQYI